MSYPTWKRWTILFCGLFENLIFSGSILGNRLVVPLVTLVSLRPSTGWSALNYILKQEGVFSELCYDDLRVSPLPSIPLLSSPNADEMRLEALESVRQLHNFTYTLPSRYHGTPFNVTAYEPVITSFPQVSVVRLWRQTVKECESDRIQVNV